MKDVNPKKHARPHYTKQKSAPVKAKKQTRKGGKGTSLMHAAARRQSTAEAADSNVSPKMKGQGTPSPNRADYELSRLQKPGGH
jgi:hypothetical protein